MAAGAASRRPPRRPQDMEEEPSMAGGLQGRRARCETTTVAGVLTCPCIWLGGWRCPPWRPRAASAVATRAAHVSGAAGIVLPLTVQLRRAEGARPPPPTAAGRSPRVITDVAPAHDCQRPSRPIGGADRRPFRSPASKFKLPEHPRLRCGCIWTNSAPPLPPPPPTPPHHSTVGSPLLVWLGGGVTAPSWAAVA